MSRGGVTVSAPFGSWPRGLGGASFPGLSACPLLARQQVRCGRPGSPTVNGTPKLWSERRHSDSAALDPATLAQQGKGAHAMSRSIARTLGIFAVVAALTTSHAIALAAPLTVSPPIYAKKQASTLAGLSPELAAGAVRAARSRPSAPRLTTQGGTTQSGESDKELDLLCGDDWFITWDEDANGNPISHTFYLHCAGESVQIG